MKCDGLHQGKFWSADSFADHNLVYQWLSSWPESNHMLIDCAVLELQFTSKNIIHPKSNSEYCCWDHVLKKTQWSCGLVCCRLSRIFIEGSVEESTNFISFWFCEVPLPKIEVEPFLGQRICYGIPVPVNMLDREMLKSIQQIVSLPHNRLQ